MKRSIGVNTRNIKFIFPLVMNNSRRNTILKNSPILKWGIFFFALFCSFLPLQSQINIKIGYIPAFSSFNEINGLLNQYNADNSGSLENSFSELHFMHGIEVGLRYKISSVAFELDWLNMSRDRDVLLYFDNSDSFQSELYNFSLNSFSFSLDQYINRVGFGVGIYSQKLGISREIDSNNLQLVSERKYALDFHLNFVMQSSNIVSFVVKPYYRFSLGKYDLLAFREDLLSNSSLDSKSNLTLFGIRFLFYNGKQ